jgi:hypothetical protein
MSAAPRLVMVRPGPPSAADTSIELVARTRASAQGAIAEDAIRRSAGEVPRASTGRSVLTDGTRLPHDDEKAVIPPMTSHGSY